MEDAEEKNVEANRSMHETWHKLVDEAKNVAVKQITFVEPVKSRRLSTCYQLSAESTAVFEASVFLCIVFTAIGQENFAPSRCGHGQWHEMLSQQ